MSKGQGKEQKNPMSKYPSPGSIV